MKKYDGLFIFVTVAKDEALDTQIEKASAEITRLSGTVLSVEPLGKKNFARTMQKHDSGAYVKIRFEMDPAQVAPLMARYQLLEDFFRVQILTVDERREAIIAKQVEQEKIREAARAAAMAAKLAEREQQEAEAAAAATAEDVTEEME
ncbi:MAG: 30S ribosomal protein S6 [Kiritimatiellaeota bacterium]|nr:30S ribosomal protein S6 [Kiritimatiellota bacterium]